MTALASLHPQTMRKLATALASGRIAQPFSSFGLNQALGAGDYTGLSHELNLLVGDGDPLRLIGNCLEILAGRSERNTEGDLDLIWSGPDEPESLAESTQVTVRELFLSAKKEIFVTGYALYNGRQIFEPLAKRMAESPGLKVTLVMNIQRKDNDTSLDENVVFRWKQQFFKKQWPGDNKPQLYFDPRSLLMDRAKRAVMHAKCIIVDKSVALVSSANLTEAALCRNIEAGFVVRDELVVARLQRNFEVLVQKGHLNPV
jgi:phosphatidylserine/phosphatidylglycerophosphate/cardiolipin synthase-like enzyme